MPVKCLIPLFSDSAFQFRLVLRKIELDFDQRRRIQRCRKGRSLGRSWGLLRFRCGCGTTRRDLRIRKRRRRRRRKRVQRPIDRGNQLWLHLVITWLLCPLISLAFPILTLPAKGSSSFLWVSKLLFFLCDISKPFC